MEEEKGMIRKSVTMKKHNSCLHGKLSASHDEWPTASLEGVEDKSDLMAYVSEQER